MDPYAILEAYLNKKAHFSKEETSIFLEAFELKKLKKRQFIIQPNFVANHRNFVVEGSLRAYIVSDNGTNHTIQLAIKDWWISDYNSYIYQQPATMFVIAMEDSVVLQISYEKEKELKASHYAFETFFREMAERSAAYMQRRIISNLVLDAEARYVHFLETYPDIVATIPQYALASFLGMSTEFLSRIRSKRSKKN
ncbi:Crp/Fnr family transcriptional regulator [Rhizosphaericola mali]|uniref:Crp/Fnr family transcriptional regulator n=1 Tax=Rhizosphaericola mali TaxID=2545455 RepID=A0A5P2G6Z0_9BACT|nr:Crp/Fnr family transcriptional regulator [Rhizosphaericola mali]QES87281.1 Crp/Fnr family transcriptional regulator [Rhizosphaericola mali]